MLSPRPLQYARRRRPPDDPHSVTFAIVGAWGIVFGAARVLLGLGLVVIAWPMSLHEISSEAAIYLIASWILAWVLLAGSVASLMRVRSARKCLAFGALIDALIGTALLVYCILTLERREALWFVSIVRVIQGLVWMSMYSSSAAKAHFDAPLTGTR